MAAQELIPLDTSSLIVHFSQRMVSSIAGLSLEKGRLTKKLSKVHPKTLVPWSGQDGGVAVLGEKGDAVLWSARMGKVLERLPLGLTVPTHFSDIILAASDYLVLRKPPTQGHGDPAGVMVLDIKTGEIRSEYCGNSGNGLKCIIKLDGGRYATLEGGGSWRIWRDDLDPVTECYVSSYGGTGLGKDVVLNQPTILKYDLLDLSQGKAVRPLAIKHPGAGVAVGDGIYAFWSAPDNSSRKNAKGILCTGRGPKWKLSKLKLDRLVRFGAPLGDGKLALVRYAEDRVDLFQTEPLSLLGTFDAPEPIQHVAATNTELLLQYETSIERYGLI